MREIVVPGKKPVCYPTGKGIHKEPPTSVLPKTTPWARMDFSDADLRVSQAVPAAQSMVAQAVTVTTFMLSL